MRKFHYLGLWAVVLTTGVCVSEITHAQSYPSKNIRLTIPFPPGGASDILARAVADRLTDSLKQRVIVDNRPGGGGLIAIDLVAHAPADGYSLLQIAASFVINPSLYKKLPYNAQTDFSAISILAIADNILVAHPSLPTRSVRDLIALAKKRPGQLNYGHSGYGTQSFLAAELFKQMAEVDVVPIPYKGAPAALLDVIAGQIQIIFAGAPPALTHVRSGKLRPLAVGGKNRLPQLPGVPTLAETLPGFEASVWYGFLAPAGTPQEIVVRLNAEVNKILQLPATKEFLMANGFRIASPMTPEAFSAYMISEGEKWAQVLKQSGVSATN